MITVLSDERTCHPDPWVPASGRWRISTPEENPPGPYGFSRGDVITMLLHAIIMPYNVVMLPMMDNK